MKVYEYMAKSGIPAHLKGFEATRRAIELCMEIPDISFSKIYEIVAKEKGITKFAAERRIRLAVQQGFKFMDEDLKCVLFLNKERVQSIEYVKTVAYAINNNLI